MTVDFVNADPTITTGALDQPRNLGNDGRALDANAGRKNKRPILASLKAAQASFDRGDMIPALNQLQACGNKVRAQLDPPLSDAIIAVINSIRYRNSFQCDRIARPSEPQSACRVFSQTSDSFTR